MSVTTFEESVCGFSGTTMVYNKKKKREIRTQAKNRGETTDFLCQNYREERSAEHKL